MHASSYRHGASSSLTRYPARLFYPGPHPLKKPGSCRVEAETSTLGCCDHADTTAETCDTAGRAYSNLEGKVRIQGGVAWDLAGRGGWREPPYHAPVFVLTPLSPPTPRMEWTHVPLKGALAVRTRRDPRAPAQAQHRARFRGDHEIISINARPGGRRAGG